MAGCSSVPSGLERQQLAEQLAHAQGWQPLIINLPLFDLQTYLPARISPAETLVIYIEGDGFAWQTPSLPSQDPTPVNPLALKLALAHPGGNAAYLARPCQYGQAMSKHCQQRYWTGARFAPEIINASNQVIDQLKRRFNAHRLTLVGYSGGGAVATLIAARRTDVDSLITIAGNLDHQRWATKNRLTPLSSSLNPADADNVAKLSRIRQWHFVGGKDRIITPDIAESYAGRFPAGSRPVVKVEPGFDHHCCWAEQWSRLYAQTHP